MKHRLSARGIVAVALLVTVSVAARVARVAEREEAPAAKSVAVKPVKRVGSELLGGAARFLTHLSTDKPIYRAGETVYVRGVMLDANRRKPLREQVTATMEVIGPKGDTVASGFVGSQESVFGFPWTVPDGQAGGEYAIRLTFPRTGHPPAERKFDVRAYRAPRLKTQIVFVRDGYGPGDKVAASMSVERAEGGIPAGARVTIIGRVDGTEVFRGPSSVSRDGICSAIFRLPNKIARGDGTLSFVVEDGGVVETASKTIPILLQTVDLKMYPEGGELIAGLNSRVYFAAKTSVGKPADLQGIVVDDLGKTVGRFRSEHEGRGRFSITPIAGRKYQLKITQPAGISTTYALPDAKKIGAVIASPAQQLLAGKPVDLSIASSIRQTLTVTLSKREVEVASLQVDSQAGNSQQVRLTPPATADGVLVATVWDADGKPLAERLIFREPVNGIQVQVSADRSRYVPGGKASLKIKTTNANGDPIAAVVGLTVTDDSVLEMIDRREQAPRLPVMVFLEDEVQELADAHVYLDASNPKASTAVDLLLGTQGWRRFAFVDVNKFIATHDDAARRVLALRMVAEIELAETLAFRGPGRVVPLPQAAEVRPDDAAAEQEQEKVKKVVDKVKAVRRPRAGQLEAKQRDEFNADLPAKREARRESDAKKKLRANLDLAARRLKADRRIVAQKPGGRMAFRMVAIRVFAHKARADRQPGERTDFAETLYWHAGIKTAQDTGEATVSFDLNDSVTSFKVSADAFDANGALGSGTSKIESVEPFYIEPKLPLEVTQHDKIDVPFALVNSTDEALPISEIVVSAPGAYTVDLPVKELAPLQRARGIISIEIGKFVGKADVTIAATAGVFGDQVTRKLNVVPLGFPVEIAHGGMLYANETVAHEIVIPDDIVPGSISTAAKVFPTPLGNMTAALERLIREPNGCFEQTSSSTYPLIMAQQYFQTHTGVDPSLIERSNAMLDKGYKRLIGYECKQGGFEWFGADPGHEALTAYGLMEFTDMSQVKDVDSEMLSRTRDWLLGTRNGEGGFTRKRRALHTWVTDPDVSNAYITWALLSAGERSLDAEVANVIGSAKKSQNTYVLALAANVAVLSGNKNAALELSDRLVKLQESNGSVQGATQSIVGSGGEALQIEATALTALAWTSDIDYIDHADAAVRYLAGTCKAGRYGSTQSTVLALKAIVEYDKAQAKPKSPGSVQLVLDGKPIGQPVAFDKNTQGTIELAQFGEHLKPGKHTLGVRMTDGSSMPHALSINLFSTKPASSKDASVKLNAELRNANLTEGDVTEVNVKLVNLSDKVVTNPMAIIGIPGGLEVRHDQLKELVKSNKIAAYEVIGRDVVLYWRELAAEGTVRLPISVTGAVPGKFAGPASRTYLYYTDEHKHWVSGLDVSISGKR